MEKATDKSVLVLKFSGPIQSWSISRDPDRKNVYTQSMPTKSGSVGLLASARGNTRMDDISDINELRFGIKVEDAGSITTDYQSSLPPTARNAYISTFEYIQDGCFLVGFEGSDREFLEGLLEDIHHPAFPLYLGRKKCIPDPGIGVGVFDGTLEDVLKEAKAPLYKSKDPDSIKPVYVETTDNPGILIRDYAITFDPRYRTRKMCGYRKVQ